MYCYKIHPVSFLVFFCVFFVHGLIRAQDFPNALEITETVVDYDTKEKLSDVNILILQKQEDSSFVEYARWKTNKKGNLVSQLELQKEYLISFSKKGYITKKIIVSTFMDVSQEDFHEHENILLLTSKVRSEQDSIALLDKPVVRVYYSNIMGFTFDSLYVRQMKKQVRNLPPDLTKTLIESLEQMTQSDNGPADDKAYQELLNKVEKERVARIVDAEKGLDGGKGKAYADSIAKADEEARKKAYADSIAKVDEEAAKKAMAYADSIAKADEEARKKAYADSIAKANAEAKNKGIAYTDSMAKVEKENKRKALAYADSLAKAEKARAMAYKDSVDKARKARLDSIAHARKLKRDSLIALKDKDPIIPFVPKIDTNKVAPPVQKNPSTPLLVLDKEEVNQRKAIDELNEKGQLASERISILEKEVRLEKKKSSNMEAKYQVGSPFNSLLDEIDQHAKVHKTKDKP